MLYDTTCSALKPPVLKPAHRLEYALHLDMFAVWGTGCREGASLDTTAPKYERTLYPCSLGPDSYVWYDSEKKPTQCSIMIAYIAAVDRLRRWYTNL